MRGIETTEMDSNRRRAPDVTTACRIAGSLVACLLLLAAPGARAEEAAWVPAPDWFREHIDFLSRDGGDFRTDNTPYRSDAEPWDAYGLKWEKGPSGQTVHGRLFGIRDGETSGSFWEYLIYWHPAEGEARIVQVGTGGAVGTGTIEPAAEDGVQRSEQTFFTPEGSFRMAHLVSNEGDVHDTQVERWVDGAWQPQRGYVWHRVREGAEEAAHSKSKG